MTLHVRYIDGNGKMDTVFLKESEVLDYMTKHDETGLRLALGRVIKRMMPCMGVVDWEIREAEE